MSDEDNVFGGFTPAAPILPSRATGETRPMTPLPQTEERRAPRKRAAPRKAMPKRAAPAKKRRKTVAKKKAKAPAVPSAPKNPNRPLEAKTRLHSVLTIVAALSKQESIAFAGMMSHLEDMAGPARKRVISALAQVYA